MKYNDYKTILKDYTDFLKPSDKTQSYTESKHDPSSDAGGKAYKKALEYKELIISNRITPIEQNYNNSLFVGVRFEGMARGFGYWGENYDTIPMHGTKGIFYYGDVVMSEKEMRPGQSIGKPRIERWDGSDYDTSLSGNGFDKTKVMGVVHFSSLTEKFDSGGLKEAKRMTDLDIAISGKFIYMIAHDVISQGDLLEFSVIKLKLADGSEFTEHGVKKATAETKVIGKAYSSGLPNPEILNVHSKLGRNLVGVRLMNV